MDATQPAKSQCDNACLHCGTTLEQKSGPGRIRQFCNGDHGKAYRRQMRALGFPI
ncbi:hypothetical protein [Streptomyces sp. NPDC087317]|uniref:hypothetical protein n=1 Tax=Streptomyces sp. NPDC087317 TaxID=3365784 RepID=UPI003813FDE7